MQWKLTKQKENNSNINYTHYCKSNIYMYILDKSARRAGLQMYMGGETICKEISIA